MTIIKNTFVFVSGQAEEAGWPQRHRPKEGSITFHNAKMNFFSSCNKSKL